MRLFAAEHRFLQFLSNELEKRTGSGRWSVLRTEHAWRIQDWKCVCITARMFSIGEAFDYDQVAISDYL